MLNVGFIHFSWCLFNQCINPSQIILPLAGMGKLLSPGWCGAARHKDAALLPLQS